MTRRPHLLAADHIRELTRPYTTTERVTQPHQDPDGKWRTRPRNHTVTHKALLDQLEDAITGASSLADEDAGRGTFTSKPAARMEALEVLSDIETQSHQLAVDLGLEEPDRTLTKGKRLPLRDRLSAISGQVGDHQHPQVRSWWARARVATQWDARPFQPKDAPCPIPECEQVGTLRIRLADELATCTGCGQVWDGPAELGVLARHVRWATEHELAKPRHWLVDAGGELVECVECLLVRDAMGERAALRAQQARGKGGRIAS